MKIVYSGHRYITDKDLDIINNRVTRDVRDPDVEEIFFGGALGVDSHALRFAHKARGGRPTPLFTVVCPDTVDQLPQLAKAWALKYADRFVELGNPIRREDGWSSLHIRNRWMIDRIKDCGQLTAFWSGRPSGTYNGIKYALSIDACWEHVQIEGEEKPPW